MVLAGVAACYAPHAPSGAPCDPVIDNCPSGLACYASGGDHRCLAGPPVEDAGDATDGTMGDAPLDAAIDAAIDAMPDAMPVTLTYTATVADCLEPDDPDPDECLDVNGDDAMAIDANDTSTSDPWVAYVRFDIDNIPSGKTVTSVTLRLTATPDPKSATNDSGVVWRVQPFTHQMLFSAEPAHIGAQPISPSQGAVAPSDEIEWPLPTTLVTANAGVYLSLTTPDDDGTEYGNLSTTFPPKLIVVVQ